ncbi:hypothetical protein [Granulosicoccus antarcticus]|uniref:Uncharacterized protein n=1 Tax=Granulosicoccus antarcticus IMCC3135 TaxID=1192854 RepID=A0A2Z2NNS9_9GAMM|nr:hypothetical protein [Granulosicoccus antarcticus]ASJ70490.1 hypothetical protein IMCC3135_01880 [Granulosicoccus antarcticus IMCC3135]
MDKSKAVLLLLTIALAGCDGSGDGGSLTGSQQDDDLSQRGINDNLSGSIVISGYTDINGARANLNTGEYVLFPANSVSTIVADEPNVNFASSWNIISASDNTANAAFAQTYPNCINEDAHLYYVGNICFATYNSDLSLIKAHRLNTTNVETPLLFSRSQQYLLANEYARHQHSDDKSIHLSVIDILSSERVLTIPVKTRLADFDGRYGRSSVEWGLNDEIIYTDARDQPPVINITKPLSTEVARRITLPSKYRGLITRMHLSPDGSQLLLQYVRNPGTAEPSRFAMILDLNTLDLRIPAVHSYDVDNIPVGDDRGNGNFKTHGWSPDGSYILLGSIWHWQVTEAYVYNFSRYELVAVPSDGVNQLVLHDLSLAAPGVVWPKYYIPNTNEFKSMFDSGSVEYTWIDNN